ncbi:MAG: HAD-IA family hydrolase [Prevotella sp.]|nr:HAD-IA family hydrolase [Prevotella sp.]
MYTLAIKQYLEKHGFEALTPKAVLFDMDGVLYDSMPNHAIAWQQSMAQFGIHMTAEDAYATEGARGVDTIRQMVKNQQGRDIDEDEAQRMYDVKSHIFHELPEAPIMPGILELMQQIKDGGILCGVVTGSGQRPLIDRILKDFGAFVDKNQITTAYDVKRGKPNPDPYLMGLKKAGNLKPNEAIVVENAPLGIRAGAAAKIFTIGVNTGPLSNELLLEAGANLLFPTMQDLSDCWYNKRLGAL